MIKFFRKIRQKLLSENRFNKYLIYAFGEIILVVIGILIALQINNWNESNQNRKKVDKLLVKIQKDIKTDISQIQRLTEYYRNKDSIILLVLNDKITREEYESPNSVQPLHLLILNKEFIRLKKDSYSNLIRMQDQIPPEYDVILDELSTLYNDLFSYVVNREERFDEESSKFADMLWEKYEWFSEYIPYYENKKRIDYFLTNTSYKGLVKAYRTSAIHNYLRISVAYADQAVSVYEKIDRILKGKSLNSELKLQLNSEFYGNYKTIANQNFPVFKDGYKTFTKNRDTIKLFPFSENKVLMDRYYLRFSKKEDTTFIYTTGYLFGKKPFAYKID